MGHYCSTLCIRYHVRTSMLGEAPKPWACGVIFTHTSPGPFVRGTAAGLVVYEPCCNPICHLTVTAGAHLPSSCFIFVALATVYLYFRVLRHCDPVLSDGTYPRSSSWPVALLTFASWFPWPGVDSIALDHRWSETDMSQGAACCQRLVATTCPVA